MAYGFSSPHSEQQAESAGFHAKEHANGGQARCRSWTKASAKPDLQITPAWDDEQGSGLSPLTRSLGTTEQEFL